MRPPTVGDHVLILMRGRLESTTADEFANNKHNISWVEFVAESIFY